MYPWAHRLWSSLRPHEKQALLSVGQKSTGLMDVLINGQTPVLTSKAFQRKVLSSEETSRLAIWKTAMLQHSSLQSWASHYAPQGLYGMEIPKEWGGLGASPLFHARMLRALASVDREGNWLHRIMVPNSLGTSQLLLEYGTQAQKHKWMLPLSRGQVVSCFGLTGPWNGSDAAGSMPVEGVFETRQGVEGIRFSTEKRWITLAPIANVLALAIRHREPNGISVILVDTKKYVSFISIRNHRPIGATFPNGHILIRDLWVPLDEAVLGGKQGVGRGWQMLMTCLQKGRGISLPSVSDGMNSTVLWKTVIFASVRRQFAKPLLDLYAVQSMVTDMTIRVYLGRILCEMYHATNGQSSVYSAVLKFVLTEFSRDVLQHGMSIFAGKGITLGDKNPIAHFYIQSPIGLTVEGSNPLTHHAIIPVQSIFEHQTAFVDVLDTLERQTPLEFYSKVLQKVPHVGHLLLRSIAHPDTLSRHYARIALESYACLLRGKGMETQQEMTRHFANHIIGTLLLTALEWVHSQPSPSTKFLTPSPHDIQLQEACKKWIYHTYFDSPSLVSSIQKTPLYPFCRNRPEVTHISHLMWSNPAFREWIIEDVVMSPDDPFHRAALRLAKKESIPLALQREIIDVNSYLDVEAEEDVQRCA